MSVNIPFKKDKSTPSIGLDYGFRMTSPNNNFKHTHSVGLRVNIGGAAKEKVVAEQPGASAYAESKEVKAESKKRGKEEQGDECEEVEEKDATIDSLIKANQSLKVKAETPVVKIDTVIQERSSGQD
jgi:hypothetical protein